MSEISANERRSAKLKALWVDPAYRAKITERKSAPACIAKVKERNSDPATKERRSLARKALWADPAYRANMLIKAKKGANSPTRRAKIESMWSKPDYRQKFSAMLKERSKSPEYLALLSNRSKSRWDDPEYKTKMCLKIKEGLPRNSATHHVAIHVKLRDPNNRVWEVHNLLKFIREHTELFDPADLNWNARGLSCRAYVALLKLTAKKNRQSTAKGWTLVSDTEVFYNGGEDLLNRQQNEVHSI